MKNKSRIFVLFLSLTATCVGAHSQATQEVSPPAVAAPKTWTPTNFPIGFWIGPPKEANNLEAYQMMKDCGFTYASTSFKWPEAENLKMLNHCEAVGLTAVVDFFSLLHPAAPQGEGWEAIAEEGVRNYATHPALEGWGLFDEPKADAFPALARLNTYMGERTPGKLRFISLLPNYATPEQLGAKTYEEYLESFMTTTKPDVLVYNHYAFMKDGTVRTDGYFQNLQQIRDAGLRHNVPAWNGILTWEHLYFSALTPEQMRWQVWTSLAYGMKGIMYFILWPYPEWKKDNAFPAIVDSEGKPSPIYPEVKKLNHTMQTLGDTLLSLTSTGVYHSGTVRPLHSKGVPADEALQLPEDKPLLIGFFRNDTTKERYAIVVNRNFNKPVEVPLQPASTVAEVQLVTGTDGVVSPMPMFDGKVSLLLAPGEGKLLKLVEQTKPRP